MENLTNEQIVEIINFYKMCGIPEDMYLSSDGVLDLFALLGIKPEFDEDGRRLLTPYEYLEIPPKFDNGREVPIIFAIKHHVSKIHKFEDKKPTTYTYVSPKELSDDKIILNKFKADYFSAVANGNMMEASRIYDLIDRITGGQADDFIGINYNCVKFYKKMQQQLMMDIFTNFVIVQILNKKASIQEGIVKIDKLYKEFVAKELKNFKLSFAGRKKMKMPKISKMVVNVAGDNENKKVVATSQKNLKKQESQNMQQNMGIQNIDSEQPDTKGLISLIKRKVRGKIKIFREKFILPKTNDIQTPQVDEVDKQEKMARALENE